MVVRVSIYTSGVIEHVGSRLLVEVAYSIKDEHAKYLIKNSPMKAPTEESWLLAWETYSI
jgi:hypothetical protein